LSLRYFVGCLFFSHIIKTTNDEKDKSNIGDIRHTLLPYILFRTFSGVQDAKKGNGQSSNLCGENGRYNCDG
jgi:hypothetical protein